METVSFSSIDEARAAGFVTVSDAKTICRGTDMRVTDVSGGAWYGYEFAVKRGDETISESVSVSIRNDNPGVVPMFKREEIKGDAERGRPTFYGEKMVQTAIYLPIEMAEWIDLQDGTRSEVIRGLIKEAMNKNNPRP